MWRRSDPGVRATTHVQILVATRHGGAVPARPAPASTTGNCADFVALGDSPWTAADIADIDVDLTVVGGEIVHDDR